MKPAKARAFLTSNMFAPCTLSRKSGSFVASAGAPFAGASGYLCNHAVSVSCDYQGNEITYLSWDIRIKMSCIFGITQLRFERRGIFMYVRPVDSTEPGMGLTPLGRPASSNFIKLYTHLNELSSIDATRRRIRKYKSTASCLNNHRIWPRD